MMDSTNNNESQLPTRTYYPDDESLYYLEFHLYANANQIRWTLFQRQFIHPPEEWAKMDHGPLDFNEGHPWNLVDGLVDEREHAMSMDSRKFLIFMVDALNYAVKNQSQIKAEGFKRDVENYCRERDGY